MRMATRWRRKCVRFSGGRASRRRIRSRSARSLSFLSASSRAFLPTRGFFKHFLQNRKHGKVAWTAGCLLALDDISHGRHQNPRIAQGHFQGAFAQSFEGVYAVDFAHEVELQSVVVARDAE